MKKYLLEAKILVTLLACLPALAMAQNEAQMKQMMKQAQKAQACMMKIDRSKLEKIADEAKKMETNIKTLCDQGKRDEAQDKGMKFAQEMLKSDVALEMRKCSEMMAGIMGNSLMPGMSFPNMDEMSEQSICDSY